MSCSHKWLPLLVIGLALVASRAEAVVILQDGFEGYAASATWPNFGQDYDPGTPPVGEPWVISEGAPDKVQVLSCPAGTNYYCAGPASGSKYLQFYRNDAPYSIAWAPLSAANSALLTEKTLTVDMMIYKNSIDGWTGQGMISSFNSAPGSFTGRAFDFYFQDDSKVRYYDGSYHDTGLTYTKDEWQHLTVVADFKSRTYMLGLEGNWTPALPFAENVSTIQTLFLGGEALNARAAFDDVTMSITAPSCNVLFYDNFQTDYAGTSPTSGSYDPVIAVGDVGGSWVITEPGVPTYLQVLNDDSIGSGVPGPNNYVHSRRDGVDNQGWPRATGWDGDKTDGVPLEMKCSIYIPSSNQSIVGIGGFDDPTGFSGRTFDVYFGDNGLMRFYDGSDYHDTTLAYQEDKWLDLVVVADMSTGKYRLSVDGQWAAEELFWNGGATKIQSFLFYNNGNNTEFYLDNVSLTVIPEPASLVLLALGGLGLAAVLRRKRK